MKKRFLACFLCVIALGLSACGEQEVSTGSMETVQDRIEPVETTKEDPVKIKIYYCSVSTAGLDYAIEEVKEIKPEAIISRLSHHNIVSIDTRVLDFKEEKENGCKLLTLDLSKAFGEYLSTMGGQSEKIIMEALANTFLEAYQADQIQVLIEGRSLTTSNHSYEEPLVFTKLDKEQDVVASPEAGEYRVERVEDDSISQDDGQIQIAYPIIVADAEDETVKAINSRLKEYALALYERENTEQLSCDYEVTYMDQNLISIVFRGTMKWKGNDRTYSYAVSFNLDLASGQSFRPLQGVDTQKLADRLLCFDNCEMCSDMEVDTFILQLETYYPKLGESLEKFDFDFDEVFSVAQGYSYRMEDGIGLIIPVSDETLDYVEVRVLN